MSHRDRITEILERSGIPACSEDDPIYKEPPTILFVNRPGKPAAAPAPRTAPPRAPVEWGSCPYEGIREAMEASMLAGVIAQGMPPAGFREILAKNPSLRSMCREELAKHYGWTDERIDAEFGLEDPEESG